MRRILICVLLALPGLAMAKDISVTSKVEEVTVYPDMAMVVRRASVEVEAGAYRLIVPEINLSADREIYSIEIEGAVRTAVTFSPVPMDVTQDGPEVIDRLAALEQAVFDLEAEIAEVLAPAEAAQATIGLLSGLNLDAGSGDVSALSGEVMTEIAKLSAVSREVDRQVAPLRRKLAQMQTRLGVARDVLPGDVAATSVGRPMTIGVVKEAAGPVAIEIRYFVIGSAGWRVDYEFHLDSKSGAVEVQRDARVFQASGEDWRDVMLTLSTQDPTSRGKSRQVYPRRRWIEEPRREEDAYARSDVVIESPVIVEEAVETGVVADGSAYRYAFARPVSVFSHSGPTALAMESVELAGAMYARAVPRHDETAYRHVALENTAGEDLLPSEIAMHFVDGAMTLASYFDGVVAGDVFELGFGQIPGLQLAFQRPSRSTGDTGIITRSNRQVKTAEFEIRNLTGRMWPVLLVDRVDFSEQEDLEISWRADPAPSEVDLDGETGVLGWRFDLPVGAERMISVVTELNWPDGMELR